MRARILNFAPPAIHAEQPVPAGAVFFFGNRPLMIVEAHGTDPAAPVICEELEWHNPSLPGQLCLWSLDCVRRAMRNQVAA